jgi:inhibitor of cysteine peptidase
MNFLFVVSLHVYLFMEITMNRLFVLSMAAILLAGCATSSPTPTATLPPTAETPSTLPEPSDPTQLLAVPTGEEFDLVLPSNPSTGYHWELVEELDENIVQLVGQDYIAEQPVVPGSGGVDVWAFLAVNAGDTTIMFGYYPPGNDVEPAETVIFSIAVE